MPKHINEHALRLKVSENLLSAESLDPLGKPQSETSSPTNLPQYMRDTKVLFSTFGTIIRHLPLFFSSSRLEVLLYLLYNHQNTHASRALRKLAVDWAP